MVPPVPPRIYSVTRKTGGLLKSGLSIKTIYIRRRVSNMASKNFTLLLYLGFLMHFIHAVPERGIKEMLFDEVMLSFKSFVLLYFVSST
jgi:hypothetical protein